MIAASISNQNENQHRRKLLFMSPAFYHAASPVASHTYTPVPLRSNTQFRFHGIFIEY